MRWTRRSSRTAAAPSILTVAALGLALLPIHSGCALSPSAAGVSTATVPVPVAAPAMTAAAAAGGEAVEHPDDMRVMTFNLRVRTLFDGLNHWGFRKELLVRTVRRFDPDILSTQECLDDQADYLRARLPGYEFVGAGRSDGARRGEMCAVFYRASAFERLDHGHFWLSDEPHEPGSKSWGAWFPRMATWVKLRHRDGSGPDFFVFNTHLEHSRSRARERQALVLREHMERIAGDAPVLLTGDFNTDEGTAPYRTLLAAIGEPLYDAFRAANPLRRRDGEGTRHGFGGRTRGPRIDWILASTGDFQTIDADIDRTSDRSRYPSDHFAVTAVLRPVRLASTAAPAGPRADAAAPGADAGDPRPRRAFPQAPMAQIE